MLEYNIQAQPGEEYTITVKTDQIGLIAAIQRNIRRYNRIDARLKWREGVIDANNHRHTRTNPV